MQCSVPVVPSITCTIPSPHPSKDAATATLITIGFLCNLMAWSLVNIRGRLPIPEFWIGLWDLYAPRYFGSRLDGVLNWERDGHNAIRVGEVVGLRI